MTDRCVRRTACTIDSSVLLAVTVRFPVLLLINGVSPDADVYSCRRRPAANRFIIGCFSVDALRMAGSPHIVQTIGDPDTDRFGTTASVR